MRHGQSLGARDPHLNGLPSTEDVCIGESGVCPPGDCDGPYEYLERQDQTESYDA